MSDKENTKDIKISFPQLNTLIWIVLIIGLAYFLLQTTSQRSQEANRTEMRGRITQCGQSLGYTQTVWYKQNFSDAGNLADMNYDAQKNKWPADFTKCVDEKTE